MNRKMMAAVAFMLTLLISVSCTKPDDPYNGGINENNDTLLVTHEFVDLGLPSGTLWATCNVGARSPEDRGDYFAWGETITKDMYDWKQYKYAAYGDDCFLLTKYCSDSTCGYDGFVDTLSVLESMDDAVVANWGDGWRMPTKEDWAELIGNTTNTMTVQNGVEGRLFESANGNRLFLPNTGFYLDDEIICSTLGIYWSSSLQKTFQIVAWSFHSDLDECHVCGTYERSRGQCVRAVRVMK